MRTLRRHHRMPIFLIAVTSLIPGCTADRDSVPTGGSPHSASGPAATRPATPPSQTTAHPTSPENQETPVTPAADPSLETATFAAGCFWCVEAVLQQLAGVDSVRSGYMGGHVENPTYQAVCSGETGHAEVVQVRFDPQRIGYGKLLEWFFELHDPTTLNRQGADVGTQYRSAIFYHSQGQREAAERVRKKIDAAGVFDAPLVTEITAASTFYPAEADHQDYYRQNKQAGYCRAVITPKLEKLGLDK